MSTTLNLQNIFPLLQLQEDTCQWNWRRLRRLAKSFSGLSIYGTCSNRNLFDTLPRSCQREIARPSPLRSAWNPLHEEHYDSWQQMETVWDTSCLYMHRKATKGVIKSAAPNMQTHLCYEPLIATRFHERIFVFI